MIYIPKDTSKVDQNMSNDAVTALKPCMVLRV